jgi:hypothetical protein
MQCGAILCAAALCFALGMGAQTADWKSYSYPAEGFQASYPTLPTIEKKEVETEAGTFELRSYRAETGDVALFIGVCDFGQKAPGTAPEAMLQGAKNGLLMNSNAHLTRERKITLGSYHGLEFEAESDSAHVTVRFYMVGTTLYEALVVHPLSKPYVQTAKFLDSFQLIPRTTGQ